VLLCQKQLKLSRIVDEYKPLLRGVLNVAAIKAPGFGERRKSLLQVGTT